MGCRSRAEFSTDRRCRKKGSDADAYAEAMQKVGYKLYEYSTKSNAEERELGGLARIIPVTEGRSLSGSIRPIRGLFLICRKMAQMQKTGADDFAECRAEFRAVVGAELYAEKWY
jgi:hypothetical protein